MFRFAFLTAVLAAGPAFAHPGHLADVAGHDHWVAGAARGAAIAIAVWGAIKGKSEDKSEAEPETDAEPQEA